MDVRLVNRALRAAVWRPLETDGFVDRTDRLAWRYGPRWIDLVEVTSIGPSADAVGCTSYSFGAHVASVPSYLRLGHMAVGKDGRPRPHYWNTPLRRTLAKTLRQPWFRPFAALEPPGLTPGRRAHREGLMKVMRREEHDRPDTWFVLDDGSNLDEDVANLLDVLNQTGLPLLERFHDPCAVRQLLDNDELQMRASSPAGQELLSAAMAACARADEVLLTG